MNYSENKDWYKQYSSGQLQKSWVIEHKMTNAKNQNNLNYKF